MEPTPQEKAAEEGIKMDVGPFQGIFLDHPDPPPKDEDRLDGLFTRLDDIQRGLSDTSADNVQRTLLKDQIGILIHEIDTTQGTSDVPMPMTKEYFLRFVKRSCQNCLNSRLLSGSVINVGESMKAVDWPSTRVNLIGYLATCPRVEPRQVPDVNATNDEPCKNMMEKMGCRFKALDEMGEAELEQKAGELIDLL